VIVISDIHAGCRMGLCPPAGITVDDGGLYTPSKMQLVMWAWWRSFWDEWVPSVCRDEPYAVVFNGDSLDGVHHGSTTQISHNLDDQAQLARDILDPVVEACEGRYYHIRGTEAHVGKSGAEENRLARTLGAIPNEEGQFARYDLWLEIGDRLIHFLHHIGTTSSNAYEATAVMKELTEEFNEAARWHEQPPDIIARSHRHRNFEIRVPAANGYAIAFVTPAWQLKTPFCWKIAGARLAPSQIGGSIIRLGDEDLYTRHKTWSVGRSKRERAGRRRGDKAKA